MAQFPKLGEVLVKQGLVTSDQVEAALALQKTNKKRIGTILVDQGWLSEIQLAKGLAHMAGLLAIDLSRVPADIEASKHIEEAFCREHNLVPVMFKSIHGKTQLVIAFSDPFELDVLEDLRFRTSVPIYRVVGTLSEIQSHIHKVYKQAPQTSVSAKNPDLSATPSPGPESSQALQSLIRMLHRKGVLTLEEQQSLLGSLTQADKPLA